MYLLQDLRISSNASFVSAVIITMISVLLLFIVIFIICLLQLGIRITISVEKEPLGTGPWQLFSV